MNVDSRERNPEVPSIGGRSCSSDPRSQKALLAACFRLRRRHLATGLAALALAIPLPSSGSEPENGKRVENRGTPIQSTAQPAAPKPEPPGAARPEPKPECEVVKQTRVEETTTVEEVRVVQTIEIPAPEISSDTTRPSDFLAFDDVLQNTLGRRKVTTVMACTDGRNPLPSYAFVGIQPPFPPAEPLRTSRLQRFECELEAGSDWDPVHSVFTLAVGASFFQFTVPVSDVPSPFIARDAMTQPLFPFLVGLSKHRAASSSDRYRLSIHWKDAERGQAPRVVEGDGIYLSVDPAPTAPPIYGTPAFVLVERNPNAVSSLRLIEKSGSAVSILPNLNDLDLAAFCSVVHLLRP